MYLGNPLLPINLTAAKAAEGIKKQLLEKNWHEHELSPLKLKLVPYFLFNYHYYMETDSTNHKIIKNSVDGVLAVDGHDICVREDLVELIKHNWKKGTPQIPRGEFEEKWNNIEKKEQEEVLTLKTAEFFKIPKNNVVVSSAKRMLIPFYRTTLKAGGKEYPLIVNAVDGKIEGTEKVPEREKGYLELTKETIDELKDPRNWLRYSKEAIVEGSATVAKRVTQTNVHGSKATSEVKVTASSSFLNSRWVLILVMILAIILIIWGLFRVKPF